MNNKKNRLRVLLANQSKFNTLMYRRFVGHSREWVTSVLLKKRNLNDLFGVGFLYI